MKITSITPQQKDKNRINIFVDGAYRFSLDITQYADLGIKIGKEYTEEDLIALEQESQFGKLYTRTLEYCLMRPHSSKEVKDYLYKKTRDTKTKSGTTKKGVSPALAERVLEKLTVRGYVNDESFSRFWVENRNLRKGVSTRKLRAELQAKGVSAVTIQNALSESTRNDNDELIKIIEKKRSRYSDDQKFMQYLARQGFAYDTIKAALYTND